MTGVMGFIAQCEVCPQKAILIDQPDGWVCPRCVEVTAPVFALPPRSRCSLPGCTSCHMPCTDQVIAVKLNDGTIRTERVGAKPDPDMMRRAQRTVAEVSAMADRLMAETMVADHVGGFGDVDVAQADPIVQLQPQPLTIPMSDPLAAAIVREVAQRPAQPLITALVGGRTFQFTGYTQRGGEPLETVWINEADLRLPREPIMWGAPVDELELPYKPPVKDHAFRAPTLACAARVLPDDDDEYPLGRIQG
jgi:hypothetical protein